MAKGGPEKLLYCSFCGKSQHEVKKLIAGPSVFICDECISLCNDIIRDEISEDRPGLISSDLPADVGNSGCHEKNRRVQCAARRNNNLRLHAKFGAGLSADAVRKTGDNFSGVSALVDDLSCTAVREHLRAGLQR